MKVSVPDGRYVVAVSGGVDSMTLLDMLAKRPGLDLVVAHFDHGIRTDSAEDAKVVTAATAGYGLKLEIGHGELGSGASEDVARTARYIFLNEVRRRYDADKIITAHHQDDLIETAILNILRGTGPKGLTAIKENKSILRPLLKIPKSEIVDYARSRALNWREDPTNQDLKYLRNYVRQKIMPKLTTEDRQKILENIDKVAKNSGEKQRLLAAISRQVSQKGLIDRQVFTALPLEVGHELTSYWLVELGMPDIDKPTIRRIAMALKTAAAGTRHNVRGQSYLAVGPRYGRFDISVD